MRLSSALVVLVIVAGMVGFGMYHDATTPDNPFESDPIVINTTYSENVSVTYPTAVNDSIQYWNTHSSTYGNWSANLTFKPDAKNADVTILFVEEIDMCGFSVSLYTEFTGCTDIVIKEDEYEHSTMRSLATDQK